MAALRESRGNGWRKGTFDRRLAALSKVPLRYFRQEITSAR